MSLNKVCSLFIAFCVIEKCNCSLPNPETTIKPETESDDFVCSSSVIQQGQNIHCEISFRFTNEDLDEDPICINDTRKVLHVLNRCLVSRAHTRPKEGKAKFSNTSLTCTSSSPMSVNVDFFDGNPNSLFSVVRQEIMSDDYPYTHKVTIDLPGNVAYIYRENVLIKYTIYNSDEPSSRLNVFLEFWTGFLPRSFIPRDGATIDISQNILHIPCFEFDFRYNERFGLFRTISDSDILFSDNVTSDSSSCTTLDNLIADLEISFRKSNKFVIGLHLSESPSPLLNSYAGLDEIKPVIKESLEDILNSSSSSLLFEIIPDYDFDKCPANNIQFGDFTTLIKAFRLKEYFQPDNNSVTLDKYDGISINLNEFSKNISGRYTCGSTEQGFTLLQKDFQFSPKEDITFLQKERYNILSHSVKQTEVAVKCSRASRNVSINRANWLEPDELKIARGIQFNYSKSSKRYFGNALIPVLDSPGEYLNVTVDGQKFRKFYVECDTKQWTFYYDQRRILYYSPKDKMLICSDWAGQFWRKNYQFTLHHWKCDNYHSCQILYLNCLSLSKETDTNTKKNCMNSLLTKSATLCNEEQMYTNGDFANCKTLVPHDKGIVQCTVTYGEDGINFNVIQTYFRGFDGILYIEMDMDSEPPLNSILRLTTLLEEKEITNNVVYTKQNYVFLCEAHSYFYLDGLRWFLIFRNGTEVEIMDSAVRKFDNPGSNSNPLSHIEVYVHDVSIKQIICSASEIGSNKWKNISVNLNVFDSTPSQILNTESEIYISDGKDQSAACRAGGIPTPEISWTRIQNGVEEAVEKSDQLFAAGQTVLLFANFNDSKSTGEYVCKARNVAGNDTKHFKVLTRSSYAYIYALVGVGLLLTGTIAISILAYLRNEKVKRLQIMKEIIDLLYGSEKPKPSDENDDYVDPIQLPFDKKNEIKKNSFIIHREKLLGRGNFGEVYKGILEGVEGYVAFKTLRTNCDICHLKALVSELKILCYIGHHDNLVTLLGAYIQDILQGVLYVAIELCDLGSLESYLRSYRHIFQKCPILAEEAKEPNMRNTEEVINSGRATFPMHSVQSLLKWCCQLANGMEYLGSKNVIHSDLATRNVLLTAEGNAKITDFGLSRRLYYETVYVKTAKDPLPWRWLAIEVIRGKIFSAKSDIWAFGITLWEIFTLGDIPYPGMEYTTDFIQELEKGLRNNKPKHASLELFDIMKRCWCLDPNDRPTFSTLKMIFQHAVVNNKVNVDRKILEVEDLEMLAKELASADYVTCQRNSI